LNYQGCADIGVCFPPDSFTLPTQWNATDGASATAELGKLTNNEQPPRLALSEQDQLAAQLGSSSLWFNAAAFYLFGLLLAFTPCVLPMVPILSSIILGGNQEWH